MAPQTTEPTTDVQVQLGLRVATAVEAALGLELSPAEALIRPSARGREADFQSSVAMKLGKELGQRPLEVAERIAAELPAGGAVGSCVVSPPGFLNLVVSHEWLADAIATIAGDPRLGVPLAPVTLRAIIDYSAPNVAKEMHVGHLRSTIIGDALARITEFIGATAIPQNHVGDWGTPFGMLLEYLDDQGWDSEHHGEIEDSTASIARRGRGSTASRALPTARAGGSSFCRARTSTRSRSGSSSSTSPSVTSTRSTSCSACA